MKTPMPDFLRPVRGPDALAWVACATACVVLGVAVVDAHAAWQAREHALDAQARRTAAATALPARPAPVAASHDSAERRAVETALRRLQRPWPQAIRAIESIDVPGLSWLVLDVAEDGNLRLQGLAPDAQAAMAAARMLRRQGPWPEVVLGRMERAEGGMLRFELHGAGARVLAAATP